MRASKVRRVLIYRLGSLGDTVVALPAFHLIRRAFPNAERRVLTNHPVSGNAPPLASVLGESGLADGYFSYPIGTRNPGRLWALRRQIADWRPDVAVYLTEPRGFLGTLRDVAFLHLCGARRVIGAPYRARLRRHSTDATTGLAESEALRLGRCLSRLGAVDAHDPKNWDLCPTISEQADAVRALDGWPGGGRYIAFSIGTKLAEKDWGDENWRAVLGAVTRRFPGLGLVLIGGWPDAGRSQSLAQCWTGPVLNLCGRLSPRESALVERDAVAFLGHDSGPMHLAAATGTPAVVVFADLAAPGVWFPHGEFNRVFYPGLAWNGGARRRMAGSERGLPDIPADQVAEAAIETVGATRVALDAAPALV